MDKNEKLLEVSKVAARLGVSESTIRRMINDPDCPLCGVRIHRGCWRVKESSVALCLVARSGRVVGRSII